MPTDMAQQRARERLAPAPLPGPLLRDEQHKERERGGHQQERPGRPAQLASLYQRVEHGEQRSGQHQHAGHVGAAAPGATGRRHDECGADGGGQGDGHVDEEDRPPVPAEQVSLREQAPEQRAGEAADREGHAVEPHRPALLGFGELGVDERQHLRHHQTGEHALRDTGRQQYPDVGRGARGERGDAEAGRAQHEQGAVAEAVAEAAAGDQGEGECQRVAGGGPLQSRGLCVQVALDGRQRDVHDLVVHHVHEYRGQQQGERCPATLVRLGRSHRFPCHLVASLRDRARNGVLDQPYHIYV